MQQLVEQIRGWWIEQLDGFFGRQWEERSTVSKVAAGTAALTVLTAREVMRDRNPMMAAGLAFFTVLAIVPLLTVAASLMAAFGMLDDEGGQLFDTMHRLFPDVAAGLASYLGRVATDGAQAVGGIGAITLVIIGLVLFNYIEETFTRIWKGTHDRSYLLKLLTFWAVVTFGPVLIALSFVQTARAQFFLAEMGLNVTLLGRIAPLLYALVAFTLLFKLVPNAEVKWRSALVGGLFAAVMFELAKWGFNLYVDQMLLQTYDRVYGALALIPIGLIWVYIMWLVILVGAELAYSFQHMRQLIRAEAGRRSSLADIRQIRTVHPLAPMEVLGVILSDYHAGRGPVEQGRVVDELQLPGPIVESVLEFLREWGALVVFDGEEKRRYLPAKPAEAIELDELVRTFWRQQDWGPDEQARRLSEAYLDASCQFFGDYTGRALVEDSESEKADPPAETGQPATPEEPSTRSDDIAVVGDRS